MPVFIIREQDQRSQWRTESLSECTTKAGALRIATDRFNRGGVRRLELYRKLRYHQDLGHLIACLAVLGQEGSREAPGFSVEADQDCCPDCGQDWNIAGCSHRAAWDMPIGAAEPEDE